MPRIHDARNDSGVVVALRAIGTLVACLVAVMLLREAGRMLGDTRSPLARYREPAVMPHVFVKGTVHARKNGADGRLPALCSVAHEHRVQCGKSRCWATKESFSYSNAKVDIGWASSPLHSTMDVSSDFRFEPWEPARGEPDSARARAWREFAKSKGLGFSDSDFMLGEHRVVDSCAAEGAPVFVEACVSPTTPGLLEACPGQSYFGVVVNGDAQAARDDAADGIARYVGGAAIAFLAAALVWLRARRPLVAALEERAAPHRKTLGAMWGLLAVPPMLGISVLLMHASHPPSSWSTGRGGFALALSALAVWLFFAAQRWLHRRRTLFALAPVFATERSLLAQANGTVELAVRASGAPLRSYIGDEPVAFSEIVISETYRKGKNTTTQEVYRGQLASKVKVVDESGEGFLDLSTSVLDVEERVIQMESLSPRYVERGVEVGRHPNHVAYKIRERVIKDGEPLYVLGEVSGIALQASEGGYRTVRGTPTLGGKDAAAVLVHAGDERGLIAMLSREARSANSFAVVAAFMCTAIAAALMALARF